VTDAKAAKVEIDKSRKMLTVFGEDGQVIAVYPASIGSAEKPAPSGRLKVTSVAHNPTYKYNPNYKFKGVKSTTSFTIKPGPNNPVGSVWINLSAKGYGIHGTPSMSCYHLSFLGVFASSLQGGRGWWSGFSGALSSFITRRFASIRSLTFAEASVT
jgi:hypothetical protein